MTDLTGNQFMKEVKPDACSKKRVSEGFDFMLSWFEFVDCLYHQTADTLLYGTLTDLDLTYKNKKSFPELHAFLEKKS